MPITADEILRLETARNTLRTKAVNLGISTNTALLDELAAAYNAIVNNGTVDAEVKEGETYTIKRGWHNGGTVKGVAGGGNYSLQAKGPITPTKQQQSITSDEGYYGLSSVLLGAIPDNYNDTSSVNVTAAEVLANKIFVTAEGAVTAGTMPNIGKVTKTLDASTTSYTIAKGYHNGEGKVSVTLETKTVTPAETQQTINATSGKLISSFVVERIPTDYIVTTDATALAAQILAGATAYVNGVKVEGTMPDNGDVTESMDGLTVTSIVIPAGFTTGGTISLDDTIANALAAI